MQLRNKRELVGVTDASASVISGTGVASSINALTTYSVTVTAKDSSGNNIGHGGDIFLIQITNHCTLSGEFTWNVVSGARSTISSQIYEKMTDNGDGTYSYSYSLTNDGAITIIVKLSTGNGVYSEWYPNTSYSSPTQKVNISSILYMNAPGGSNWVDLPTSGYNYFTSYMYSTIFPPTTEVYTLTLWVDDGGSGLMYNSVAYIVYGWNSFTFSFVANKPYDFRFNWINTIGPGVYQLLWSTPTITNQIIAANYFYVMRNVGTSPIQISVAWPTGYSSSQVSYPNQCHEVWGDGLKVGSEQWDDGNNINNDGWQSDWTLITPGFAWVGGGAGSWTQWLAGYIQNFDKTACIPNWGDGIKLPIESWDDGNTANNDGCSNLWVIESGFTCSGGSLTSKDTCVACSAGYYQDPSNLSSWITHWGDGLRAGSEAWDDSNTSNEDGCSSTCASIESGYIWTGGSTSSKDTWTKWTSGYYPNSSKTVCQTSWSDGLRAGSEKWDDGNTSSGDGCKSDCSSVESGYACTGGSTTSKDTWTKWNKGFYQNDSSNPTQCVAKCGDGIRAGDEVWDDGNSISGDGWPSDCKKVEDGWAWFGGWFGVTDVWVQWDLGYDPNPDYSSWIGAEVPRDVKAISAATQAAAYMGISSNLVLTVFSSSSSSSSNSFGMMNQIQLVILLPLIGAYLPQKIYDYLKSMNASLFNLNFLPTNNSESTISFKSLFDFKQPNSFLFLLQLNSGSAFVNIIDLTTTVLIVVGVEIIILIIYVILRKTNKFQTLKSVMLKIFEMLTFGFYIGVWLETFILFLLVDFSEIHYQNKNGIKNLKSTVMSYVITALILSFILLALWQWWKSRKPEVFETQKYFVTLVEGFKASWIWRSYWFIFLIRRTLFIAIIFFMEDYKMMIKVSLFVSIQGLYFLYIICLRPQDSVKENLNDFINEVFYLYFVVFLLYFNTEDKWTDTTTEVYFWILMANNFILILIMLGRYSSITI